MHTLGQVAIPVVVILLILYRRIRRTVGFQPYHSRKLKVRVGIFAAVALMLLAFGLLHPIVWVADAVGLAAGYVLARFAIRHNEFERRESGWYYRTHTGIQVIVVALLAGRLAYRFMFINTAASTTTANNQAQMQSYSKDPWTAGVFFVLVAFYIVYYLYILRTGKERMALEDSRPNQTETS